MRQLPKKWWHDAIIYQIYLRSFQDSNHDGIGDIKGIIKRLDYLKDLGVNTLWISPHYDSPMDDNGYDVRDFFTVSKDYGTLEDFKALIHAAHQKKMAIITDLVLNHTSDEHPWFQAAKDPDHPQHKQFKDFYIWRDPKQDQTGKKTLPTRWRSWFGGPVWTYVEALDQYYLHIFSKKMPDLNWRSQAMKKALKEAIQFWIDLGVDGFRIDASNHLEKNWDFPDAHPGYEHFSSLPKHHDYLSELGKELFKPNDLLILGESGGATRKEALQYAGKDSDEFNLLIHFEHCWADTDDNNTKTPGKWAKGEIDLASIKQSFAYWINIFENEGFHTLYWHNHDHPRIVSHYGDDQTYHKKSAKMLAISLYLLPGIPIIYYGEEIGMTNVDYTKLDQFRDVEVFTEYENFIHNNASHEEAMQALRDRARDNARTPMQWSSEKYASFSTTTPWIDVNQNKDIINVAQQKRDEKSILSMYQSLIKLRKTENLAYAKVAFFDLKDSQRFNYKVKGKNHTYLVFCNFKDTPVEQPLDTLLEEKYELYLHNLDEPSQQSKFEPYEARVYRKKL